jgi:predicted RNase H-like HicB family nuclease
MRGKGGTMRHTIKAFIHKGEKFYIAECLEIAVVTQGKTLDETIANLRQAVALHLEGENPADFDLVPNPSLLVTLELEPAVVS